MTKTSHTVTLHITSTITGNNYDATHTVEAYKTSDALEKALKRTCMDGFILKGFSVN